MPAAYTDLFPEVGDPGTATTLSSPGYTAASSNTATVGSTSGWPTGTGVIFVIDESSTVAGVTKRTAGTYNEYSGTVASATLISNVTWERGDGNRNYPAGANTRVYVGLANEWGNRVVQGMVVEHKQTGAHSAVTADSIVVADGGTIEVDTVNEATAANGVTVDGLNIKDSKLVTANSVNSTVVDFGGAGAGIWWQEIGRTTLGVAGDTISVASLPSRKYLKLQINVRATGGTINVALRFNNDSGANYAGRYSVNGGADTSAVSQTRYGAQAPNTPANSLAVLEIINVSTVEKFIVGQIAGSGAGAGSNTDRWETAGKWANTAAVIDRIDLVNEGTGDYAIGSEVIVLGHN